MAVLSWLLLTMSTTAAYGIASKPALGRAGTRAQSLHRLRAKEDAPGWGELAPPDPDWGELVPPEDLVASLEKKNAVQTRRGNVGGAIGFFGCLGLSFAVVLVKPLLKHPLYPFQPDSAAWSFSWLMTTIFDYYGAALCLSAVVLSSEKRVHGLLWSFGFCLLGTPVCCCWVISRLLRTGSLRIA